MPIALITGITGQDGSYLAEFLLSKGYAVVGMVRRSSTVTFERIQHIQQHWLNNKAVVVIPVKICAVSINAIALIPFGMFR